MNYLTHIPPNSKLLTCDELIAEYSDQDQYELIDGELIDLEPTGLH